MVTGGIGRLRSGSNAKGHSNTCRSIWPAVARTAQRIGHARSVLRPQLSLVASVTWRSSLRKCTVLRTGVNLGRPPVQKARQRPRRHGTHEPIRLLVGADGPQKCCIFAVSADCVAPHVGPGPPTALARGLSGMTDLLCLRACGLAGPLIAMPHGRLEGCGWWGWRHGGGSRPGRLAANTMGAAWKPCNGCCVRCGRLRHRGRMRHTGRTASTYTHVPVAWTGCWR